MFKFMAIIMIVTVCLLFLLFLVSKVTNHKTTYTYAEIEKIMKKAAISYFKDHSDYLPKDDGSIVEVDVTNLVAEGKMSDLSEYVKEGESCSGTVQVEKDDLEYIYTPYLSCGDSYSTVELYKKVLENDKIVTTGYGLYSSGGSYVYRGEKVNNYVKLDNGLWRIVKITGNNNIVLISDSGAKYAQTWDNRYNKDKLYESGINQYAASRVKEYLDKIYNNPSEEDGEELLSKKDKTKLVSFNVCTGKRDQNSEAKDNSIECTETLKNQKLGLLTLSDYLNASIDPNCKSAATKSCKNYNYLIAKEDWWLATGNKADSSTVFQVLRSGAISVVNASNYGVVRPVIYLDSNVIYKSGKGTLEKPYKVR